MISQIQFFFFRFSRELSIVVEKYRNNMRKILQKNEFLNFFRICLRDTIQERSKINLLAAMH